MNFIYDGKSSEEFNIVIKSIKGRYDTPERDIETVIVPGRNGALHTDNRSYSTKKIEIEAYIKSDVSKYSRLINNWLYNNFDNKVLFFDDEYDIYYEGKCINKISFEETFKYFNECKIIFECMPYKKLVDGDNNINITVSNSKLYNPTNFESEPTLKIYGTGDITLTINSNNIHLTNIVEYVTIDSEIMDCYKDTMLMNNQMRGEFPKLQTGTNIISWIGNVTKVEITPKWRWL